MRTQAHPHTLFGAVDRTGDFQQTAVEQFKLGHYQPFSPGEWFGLGLNLRKPTDEVENLFEKLTPFLDSINVVGRLKEI